MRATAAYPRRGSAGVSVAAGAVIAGRYEIIDRIADGGMSTVYRARRRSDGAIVALKVLRPQYAADR